MNILSSSPIDTSSRMSTQGIEVATIILVGFSAISKMVFFARESAIAAVFGASQSVDAFVTAQLLPGLVIGGMGAVLGTAAIPLVHRIAAEGGESASWRMVRTLLISFSVLICILLLVSFLWGSLIVGLLAPGFSSQKILLSSRLMLEVVPLSGLDSMSILLIGVLQAHKHFLTGAVIPLANALLTIPLVFILGPSIGIEAVVIGWGLGSICQITVLMVMLWRPLFGRRDTNQAQPAVLGGVLKVAGPILIFYMLANVNTFVDRAVASRIGEGSVAIINWSQKLYNLPLGFLVLPMISALYPFLSQDSVTKDAEQFRRRIHRSLTITFFLILPISVMLFVLRIPIVKILFEHGSFQESDTLKTAEVLACFTIGLPAIAVFTILYRICYTIGSNWAPVAISAITSLIYVPLAIVLSETFGLAGLALAFSIIMILASLLLWYELSQRIDGFADHSLLVTFTKTLAITGITLVISVASMSFIQGSQSVSSSSLLQLFIVGSIGAFVYFVLSKALGMSLVSDGLRSVLKKVVAIRVDK